MSGQPEIQAIQRSYPLTTCPDCGYSRETLSENHRCPECGWQPREDELIFSVQRAVGVTTHRWARMIPLIVWLAFVLGRPKKQSTFGGMNVDYIVMTALAAVAGFAIWTEHRNKQKYQSGIYQIRLNPQGYSIRKGFGSPAFLPWHKRDVVKVHRGYTGKVEVRVGRYLPIIALIKSYHIVFQMVPVHQCFAVQSLCEKWIGDTSTTISQKPDLPESIIATKENK